MRKKMKSKRWTTTSHIENDTLQPRSLGSQTPQSDSVATNLRRSTRKRKISINLEDYETYSSDTEDDDLMALQYWSSGSKAENNASHDDVSAFTRKKRILNNQSHPPREGLRPRRTSRERRAQTFRETEDANDSFEEQAGKDQTANDNDAEEGGGNEEQGGVGDEEEEGNDEDGEEEQEGSRRYDLRNRADIRRHSPEKEEKQRPRSLRRALHHGMESKTNKYLQKGGSRVHKKYCTSLPDDSDDSLLVDEMDQDPAFPLTWNRSRSESLMMKKKKKKRKKVKILIDLRAILRLCFTACICLCFLLSILKFSNINYEISDNGMD